MLELFGWDVFELPIFFALEVGWFDVDIRLLVDPTHVTYFAVFLLEDCQTFFCDLQEDFGQLRPLGLRVFDPFDLMNK